MKKSSKCVSRPVSLSGTALRLLAGALVVAGAGSAISGADEVTDWNQMMLQATLTAPVTPAPVTTRVAAIVQAAVFDAINGIDRYYDPVHVPPAGPPGASKRACGVPRSLGKTAAVQAAYASLVNLFPSPEDEIRSAPRRFSGGHDRYQRRRPAGIVIRSKGRRSNMGLAKPGWFFQCASALPGCNTTRRVAANSAGHGARTGAAIGDHHSV